MKNLTRISDSEWQVMRVIWDTANITAKELCAKLPSSYDWSQKTVNTFLSRLESKGILSKKVFRGKVGPALLHLLDLMTQFSSLPSHRLSFLGLFNNIETRFIQQRIVMIKNTSKPKLPLTLVLLIGLCCTAAAVTQLTPGKDSPPLPSINNTQPPPVPEVPNSKLPITHIDEINLDFDTFNGEPKFSDGAKVFVKEKVLPIFQSGDPFPAYQLLLESPFADEAQVQFLVGSLSLQKRMMVEAELHLINAINAFPGYKRALKNLIMLYITSGHKAEAYPLLQKFLKLDPEPNATMILMAGVNAMSLEKYEEAVPLFQKVIELNPNEQNARINLFQIYVSLEDYRNAESVIQTIFANETAPEELAHFRKYYSNLTLTLENSK